MSLAARIKEVMGSTPRGEFAKVCRVSAGAVTQWLDGTTETLKAEPVALMEAKYGYRASWIVTGKGTKKIDQPAEVAWRFTEELQQKVLRLQDEELRRAENILRGFVDLPHLISSDFANSRQHSSSQHGNVPYAVATEDGAGVLDEAEVPAPKTNGRSERVQGPARRKGGGGA